MYIGAGFKKSWGLFSVFLRIHVQPFVLKFSKKKN